MCDNSATYKTTKEIRMPSYDYQCNKCAHIFGKISRIVDKNMPIMEACPSCGEYAIKQVMLSMPACIQAHKTMHGKKPDGGFREVLAKVHEQTPGSDLKSMLPFSI